MTSLSCIGEGNGNAVQRSCLENPRDGEAWWAAIYGVTQSRTRLKQLRSKGNTSDAKAVGTKRKETPDNKRPTKVRLVKAIVFPVVMYGCDSWTVKKTERQRIDAFELWC